MIIIGVDTGGTFTDFIFRSDTHGATDAPGAGDGWGVHKLLSTPDDPARAVLQGVADILEMTKADCKGGVCGGCEPCQTAQAVSVCHGSTVATNAILERKGARTGFVTNAGFEDLLEIGRQNRGRLYDLAFRRPPRLAAREDCFGVAGRVGSDGGEVAPFDEVLAREVAAKLKSRGVESVAVCLLFGFLRPEHELLMGAALAEAGLPYSLSHAVCPEFREFERASTTAVNAYVSPKMATYLGRLRERVGGRLRIMQSSGGAISAETAMRESVRTVLSGPAGGAVGALAIARAAGFERVITFDMGGTSTDVALLDGGLPLTMEAEVGGFPVKTPMIAIHTVGAGGGSLATLDAGGALTVGPESAGADPGPICYGAGAGITVTDANLYLGRLIPDRFLGGRMRLQDERLATPFEDMAAAAGLTPIDLAEGVLTVATANMERAVRVISVERGHDPREFALFSFGGAGGLHAVALARTLGMSTVIVPRNAGLLSALGMLMADVVKDYAKTVMLPEAEATPETLEAAFAPLEAQGLTDLASEGFSGDAIRLERSVDVRYQGQSFEINTPWVPGEINTPCVVGDQTGLRDAFEPLHDKTYGYVNPARAIEAVTVRVRARGLPDKPPLTAKPLGGETPEPSAKTGEHFAVFDGQRMSANVWDRDRLTPGNVIAGPAIVTEFSTTTVLPPGSAARVDGYGNLVITAQTVNGGNQSCA